MTEQIKILESFKETFSGTDNINAIDTAIRSLQAWEEVLQELEELKNEPYTMHVEEDWQDGVISAIDIINKRLAESEE